MVLSRKKKAIFGLTCWAYGTVDSTASAYSMTKQYLVHQMKITQTNLGLVDSATTLGTILGIFVLIRLTHNISKSYLMFALLHAMYFLTLIPIAKLQYQYSWVLLLVCMFFAGFCKAAIVFPQILFSSHFDSQEQQYYFTIWYGLTFLGDTSGVLLSKLIIVGLGLGWQANLVFFAIIFSLAGFCIYYFVPQPSSQPDQQIQSLSTTLTEMKGFLSNIPNKLIAADFVLEEILFFNIMLWMPYCFYLHNLQSYDYIATLSFPICITLGALIFQYPITLCPSFTNHALTFMITLNLFAFSVMFFIPLSSSTVWLHIILLAGTGLAMGTPYSRVCSGDPAEVCEGDQRKIHMAFFTVNFLRQLTQSIAYFCIGYFLERNIDSLQSINCLNCILILIIGILRRYIYPPILQSNSQRSGSAIGLTQESSK